MNVETITMDPRIARIHYRDYRDKVRDHRQVRLAEAIKEAQEAGKADRAARKKKSLIEKEDEQLMLSFRALARGERLINLPKVVVAAGLQTDNKLPALAVAGADWNSTASMAR